MPPAVQLAADVDLPALARRYELTGAGIQNVVQYACLRAADRDPTVPLLSSQDLEEGVRRELAKEGKLG